MLTITEEGEVTPDFTPSEARRDPVERGRVRRERGWEFFEVEGLVETHWPTPFCLLSLPVIGLLIPLCLNSFFSVYTGYVRENISRVCWL